MGFNSAFKGLITFTLYKRKFSLNVTTYPKEQTAHILVAETTEYCCAWRSDKHKIF